MEEDGTTLVHLLRICQPLGSTHLSGSGFTLEVGRRVWAAAQKHGMAKAAEITRGYWMSIVKNCPIQVYLTALGNGWFAEAKEAAEYAIGRSLLDATSYVPEMEWSPAEALYRLYKFQYQYQKACADISSRYSTSQRHSTSQQDYQPQRAAGIEDYSSSAAGIPVVAYPIVLREFRNADYGYGGWGGSYNHSHSRSDNPDNLVDESLAFFRDINNAIKCVSDIVLLYLSAI